MRSNTAPVTESGMPSRLMPTMMISMPLSFEASATRVFISSSISSSFSSSLLVLTSSLKAYLPITAFWALRTLPLSRSSALARSPLCLRKNSSASLILHVTNTLMRIGWASIVPVASKAHSELWIRLSNVCTSCTGQGRRKCKPGRMSALSFTSPTALPSGNVSPSTYSFTSPTALPSGNVSPSTYKSSYRTALPKRVLMATSPSRT